MATSSVIRSGEQAPVVNKGHGVDALGPSDLSDSGSDIHGAQAYPEGDMGDIEADTDAGGTGERAASDADNSAREGQDIGVDRIVSGEEIGATDIVPAYTEATPDAPRPDPTLSVSQATQESAEDMASAYEDEEEDEESDDDEILKENDLND